MEIGITSIQRDRNPYIVEWIAFHLCVGFNRLYRRTCKIIVPADTAVAPLKKEAFF